MATSGHSRSVNHKGITLARRTLLRAAIGAFCGYAMRSSGPKSVREGGRVLALPRVARVLLLVFAFLIATTANAWAASGVPSGGSEAIFIAELGLLLLVGRLMGEVAQRIGQPAVMGQLIGGLLLGPSFFGLLWPSAQHALFPGTPEQKSMIDAVSQLGILMLLLLTGMETDLPLVRRIGRAAITVAASRPLMIQSGRGGRKLHWLPRRDQIGMSALPRKLPREVISQRVR